MTESRPVPYIWHFFGTLPSTNVRISVSLLAFLATAARVVATDWAPPLEWLGFLSLWGGLDITQFGTKRTTDSAYVAAKQSGEPPTDPPPQPKPPEIGA